MRSRQDVPNIFSTYIRFESDRFDGWLVEPRLLKNMNGCLALISETQASKLFFALYWHQHWKDKTHRLALMHLGAHLQEAGYWAAYKFTSRFSLRQFSLADCFQIAFIKLEKGLESFQTGRGSSLESFAKLFFKSTIANELRRAKEIDVASDWLLLRKLTRKQFVESLKQTGGLDSQEIMQYRLAWMCFKHCYATSQQGGNQKLSKPSVETWANIAELYNQERASQLNFLCSPIDAIAIEQWLMDSIKWARKYLYPAIASLNAPKPGHDSKEAQDDLSDHEHQSLVDRVLAQEHESDRLLQQRVLSDVLNQAVTQLKSPGEGLLHQYYCEGLKQKEIAEQRAMKQFTVSRRLTSARKSLLSALVEWRQEKLPEEITPEAITDISRALELWLQSSFCKT